LSSSQEHIADLFRRYSAPIIALDLVKQHEKRPRESMVGSMYRQAIEVVNESLPVEHKVGIGACCDPPFSGVRVNGCQWLDFHLSRPLGGCLY
jgi:hypothetical protein